METSLSSVKNPRQEIKLSPRPYVTVTIDGAEALANHVKEMLDLVLDWLVVADQASLKAYVDLGVRLDNQQNKVNLEFYILEKQVGRRAHDGF